jgi:hypothetical protein
MLDWDDLDPAKVERVAQMLLRDVFGATSIDGSGGDLAQDLRWDSPDGLVIFEVKSFRKRLAGSQKRQVKKSLLRALELHAPVRWVLVTRSLPTPEELAWLQSLVPQGCGVTLEWYGRDWLDAHIAGREDLISYVEGEQYKLLRRAQQFDQERSAILTGSDLVSRVHDLLDRGDEISPYWRWEFGASPEGRFRALTPKRPEAAIDDPIQVTPTFTFPDDDPEAREMAARLHDAQRFGGDVSIPGRFVERLSVAAASAATQRLLGDRERKVDRLDITSLPDTHGLPVRAELVHAPSRGHPGVSVPVMFTSRLHGTAGQTLLGSDPSGLLDARLVLEEEDGETVGGRLNITINPAAGRLPHEVLPVLRLLTGYNPGDDLVLRVGPMPLARFTASDVWPVDLSALHRLVVALDVIQQHLQTVLPIPRKDLAPGDVRDLLTIARALSGEPARLPYSSLNSTVRPGAVQEFLQVIPPSGGALYITHEDVQFTLDDRSYDVPGLATWAPRMTLANRADLVADSDNMTERPARFEPTEGEGIYLVRAVEEPGRPRTAVEGSRPWQGDNPQALGDVAGSAL